MSRIINQNTEPLFIFDMPDDEMLSQTISVKGEKGERGDPTKLSDLENDEGFITASTSALTNYYSKTESDTALNAKLDKTTFNAYEIPSDFFTGDETVSGTGSSVSLSNTTKAAFKSIVIKGNTVQDGTPTPSDPINVGVVTGEQAITITGGDAQSFTIDLGDIKLCKLGNYQDRIYNDGDKWYIHKEIGYAVVDSLSDGSSYALDSSSTNTTRVLINKCLGEQAIYSPSSARALAKCSHFVQATNWNVDAAGFFTDTDTNLTKNGLCFRAAKDTIGTSATEVETWLNENPINVYFVLAAATETLITDKNLINQLNAIKNRAKSNVGTTIITATGDLPAVLTVEAFKDTWSGASAGINNALDIKADKYELAQRPYYCGSVAEMKKTSLEVGSYAVTTGYYTHGDGGGAEYRIVSDDALTDDGATVHTLDNGLKAVLIIKNDTINVAQFGAKGDGNADDSAAIINALAFRGDAPIQVTFCANKTYIAAGTVYLYSNTVINLYGATIKAPTELRFLTSEEAMASTGYGVVKNISIQNGTLQGATGQVIFGLLHASGVKFVDIDFIDCGRSTHTIDLGGCDHVLIRDCRFIGSYIADADNFREVIQTDYAARGGLPYWADAGSPAYDGLPTTDVTVEGCVFEIGDGTHYPNAIGTHGIRETPIKNIVIKKCIFHGCSYSNIRLPRVDNVLIDGNTFYGVNNGNDGGFAINLVAITSSSFAIVPSSNITISNNKYISTAEQGGLIFMGIIGYDNDHPTKNVKVVNNEYNGVAVSEAAYIGLDFSHIYSAEDVVVSNNVFRKAKHCIFKQQNRTIKNLTFANNVCENCLRIVRGYTNSNTDATNAPSGLIIEDNIVRTPLGTLNTSSAVIELGLSQDITVTGGSDVTIPLVVKTGYPLTAGSQNNYYVPSFIRKFRVSGCLGIKTAANQSISYTRLRYWDSVKSARTTKTFVHDVVAAGDSGKTISLGEIFVDDKTIDYLFNSNRLWTDGKYVVDVVIRATDTTTIYADKSSVFIEAF